MSDKYAWRYLSRGRIAYVEEATGRVVDEIRECIDGGSSPSAGQPHGESK